MTYALFTENKNAQQIAELDRSLNIRPDGQPSSTGFQELFDMMGKPS